MGTRRIESPVAVTGGAGFLGGEVIAQLQRDGHTDIRSIDLVARGRPFGDGGVREVVADIRHGDLTAAFEGAATVLHLAACQYHTPLARSTYKLPFFEVNVEGTRRVIDAARKAGVKRLVFVSTNMVYGLPRSLPLTEEHVREPFGPYGQSKLAAEALVEAAHGDALTTAIVRPGLIVGPGRIGVIARVFDWVLHNKPVVLVGSGRNRYELMASSDVASLVLAAASQRAFGVYNCAAASVPTMREWVGAVIDATRSRSRVIGTPGRLVKTTLRALETVHLAPLRKDQYLIADIDYYMDASHAKRELGWTPRLGGTDAILETLRWYTSPKTQTRERATGAAQSSP